MKSENSEEKSFYFGENILEKNEPRTHLVFSNEDDVLLNIYNKSTPSTNRRQVQRNFPKRWNKSSANGVSNCQDKSPIDGTSIIDSLINNDSAQEEIKKVEKKFAALGLYGDNPNDITTEMDEKLNFSGLTLEKEEKDSPCLKKVNISIPGFKKQSESEFSLINSTSVLENWEEKSVHEENHDNCVSSEEFTKDNQMSLNSLDLDDIQDCGNSGFETQVGKTPNPHVPKIYPYYQTASNEDMYYYPQYDYNGYMGNQYYNYYYGGMKPSCGSNLPLYCDNAANPGYVFEEPGDGLQDCLNNKITLSTEDSSACNNFAPNPTQYSQNVFEHSESGFNVGNNPIKHYNNGVYMMPNIPPFNYYDGYSYGPNTKGLKHRHTFVSGLNYANSSKNRNGGYKNSAFTSTASKGTEEGVFHSTCDDTSTMNQVTSVQPNISPVINSGNNQTPATTIANLTESITTLTIDSSVAENQSLNPGERKASTNVSNGNNTSGSSVETRSKLEQFRSMPSSFAHKSLKDISGCMVEFSRDQHGSRFIQQKMEHSSDGKDIELVFNEIITNGNVLFSLMTDVFGNYVIQKILEHGSDTHRNYIALKLSKNVLDLTTQMYGCRVIQKAIECIQSNLQKDLISELKGYVLECVKDQNGNHVIQKCIEYVPSENLEFIITEFEGKVYELSSHPYGCRVIQRLMEHCTYEQTQKLMLEIYKNVPTLVKDQYGNYVIQHILEHKKHRSYALKIIQYVFENIFNLSSHKFASNVVEKCIQYSTAGQKEDLIKFILKSSEGGSNDNLYLMMKDPFANYVVQKIVDSVSGELRKQLLLKMKPHFVNLKKLTYGKHMITKVDRWLKETEFIENNCSPRSSAFFKCEEDFPMLDSDQTH